LKKRGKYIFDLGCICSRVVGSNSLISISHYICNKEKQFVLSRQLQGANG
jgi:hypothetical protein